ncbi:MAG: membrane protein insertase YidC [Saccharospirillaceae bacterium]|nr:membrane protein insertase YidC [Pseudomonadales bacterium]NRB80946.1 membrane protein insertase YidC [Saccharospirillaceae bacterium]
MDYRRIALFAAFAATSLFLVIKWKSAEDIDEQALINAQQTNQSQTNVDTSFEEVITQSNIVIDTSEDDLGGVTKIAAPEQVAVIDKVTPNEASIINVQTDLLNVKIDSQTGDIIYTALNEYSVSLEHSETPVTILNNTDNYFFIAQSYLRSKRGSPLNIDSTLFEADKFEYALNEDETLEVKLTYKDQSLVKLTKIYTFYKNKYIIDVSYEVTNVSNENLFLTLDNRLKRDSSPDPAQKKTSPSFVGFAVANEDSIWEKHTFNDLEDEKEDQNLNKKGEFSFNQTVQGGFIAYSQKYFVVAWVPNQDETQHQNLGIPVGYKYNFAINKSDEVTVAIGETKTFSSKLWVGPELQDQLDELHDGLKHSVDYGIFYIFSKPIHWVLTKIQSVVPNWGWSIILLTLLVKLLFFPLSAKSMKSMAKMKKLAPKMAQLKERYGDDRQKMSQELMKFYKKEGINPVSGCLPMLVQMPIWISLYWVLIEAVEIRQMPFMFWVQDLSAADPWLVFPVLMGVSMFFQMRMTQSANMDPMQQKIFKFMPIGMTLFFIIFGMPAGLMIYWTVNNCLSICQQYLVNKQIDKEEQIAKAEAASK